MRKILALTAGAMMVAGSAMAVPILTLESGSATGTGAATATDGVYSFVGSVGGWYLNLTSGVTAPAIGSDMVPKMDVISFDATFDAGADDLVITFVDDTFGPLAAGITGFQATIGGTTEVQNGDFWITYTTSLNGNPMTDVGTVYAGLGGAFSATDTQGLPVTPGNPFELAMEITIHHGTNGGQTSFDAHLLPVPEPTTMLLLGTGLLGLAGVSRRSTRKS